MKIKGLTEVAIFCAIAVLVSLASVFIPFLVLLTFFIPVPMIVLGKRQGLKVSILSSIAASFLIGIFVGPLLALQFGVLMLLVGSSLGLAYQKNLSALKKIIIGAMGFVGFIAVIIVSYQVLTGIDFVGTMVGFFETGAQDALLLYEKSGLLEKAQLAEMKEIMAASMKVVVMSIPTIFILLPVVLSLVNVMMADLILKRLNYPVKSFKKFENLRVPSHLKVALTISLFFTFGVTVFNIQVIPEIYIVTIQNLVYLVFFIMGLACVFNFLAAKKIKSKVVKVLVVILAGLLQMAVTFLGIVDTYFNIRPLFRKEM